MKKSIILGLAILPFTGLVSMACVNYTSEFRYSLTVTLDKTEASNGDTVTATVVYKNTNYKDIEVELPEWIVAEGGRIKEDILRVVFTTEEYFKWADYIPSSQGIETKAIQLIIKQNEEIKRTFTHTITAEDDLYVHAAAFFKYGVANNFLPATGKNFNEPEIIKVQQGEPK